VPSLEPERAQEERPAPPGVRVTSRAGRPALRAPALGLGQGVEIPVQAPEMTEGRDSDTPATLPIGQGAYVTFSR